MKLILAIFFVISQGATYTDTKTKISIACGNCKNGEACDADSGSCPNGCQDGWEGTNCITAVCSEPCGNGNHCIAPEICRCAPLNTVKMIKDTNGNIAKIECENQRKSGLVKGFLPTLLVLGVTVLILKLAGLQYQRKHPQKKISKYSVISD